MGTSCHMDAGEVEGVGKGVGSRGSSWAPDSMLKGSSAHRCFWAVLLLLALAMLLLAGIMHVDVGLLMP